MTESADERWVKVRRIWEIIDQLRGEPGCPWDRKQTPASVQTYLIEEAHEAACAIRKGAVQEAAEELGDLLFMVFFMIHLYEEQRDFRLEDVCDLIISKMIRRHPHVFGNCRVNSAEDVRDNWEKIKADEKKSGGDALSRVPETLPALVRAYRILSRISQREPSAGMNELSVEAGNFSQETSRLAEKIARGETVSSMILGKLLLDFVNLIRLQGHRAEDLLHDSVRLCVQNYEDLNSRANGGH